MKKEQGVTLIALILYLILMTFILTIVVRMTTTLYFNLNEIDQNSESAVAISKINMIILNDIKNKNVSITGIDLRHIKLHNLNTLEDITYTATNGVFYRNKVKICDDVRDISITNRNNVIEIYITIGNYSKTMTYVIE